MSGIAKAGTPGQRRAVSAVGQDALDEASADGGWHAFSAGHGTWSATTGAGRLLTGATPDGLERQIRALPGDAGRRSGR